MKDNTLDILADNDQNQDPILKDTLDKLDHVSASGKVVTRFAPSPTGFLHIGGLRTAIYNYLFAKKHNGLFLLRIEDTDQKRFVGDAEKYIKDALSWVGIVPDHSPWNGGPHAPYKQSERDYSAHIKSLLDSGNAYYAFDTESDLSTARANDPNFSYGYKTRMSMKNSLSLSADETEKLINSGHPYVIRFKVPENVNIVFTDIIRGTITINSEQMDDKVLVKSNGIPTYHMANVCDDHDMEVTHVIRGEEWIPSTPLHIMLYNAFGWKIPKFAHLPLLLNPDGKGKLSKRKSLQYGFPVFPMGGEAEDDKGNMVKYQGFKDGGYDADALVNFLVLLGWSPGNNKELLTMAEMISEFSLDNVQKAGARFDIKKAEWFNSTYLRGRSNDELLKSIDTSSSPFTYDRDNLNKIVDMAKERSVFTHDLKTTTDIFFKKVNLNGIDISKVDPSFKDVMDDFINLNPDYPGAISWNADDIKQNISDICIEKGVKIGKMMPGLRIALTGGVSGPDLPTTMEILGKKETFSRIQNLISLL